MGSVEADRPGVKFNEVESLPILGKGGKKCDVYRLGMVVLSLVQATLVTEALPQVSLYRYEERVEYCERNIKIWIQVGPFAISYTKCCSILSMFI
jgi:hypothetical protein